VDESRKIPSQKITIKIRLVCPLWYALFAPYSPNKPLYPIIIIEIIGQSQNVSGNILLPVLPGTLYNIIAWADTKEIAFKMLINTSLPPRWVGLLIISEDR